MPNCQVTQKGKSRGGGSRGKSLGGVRGEKLGEKIKSFEKLGEIYKKLPESF